MILENEYEDLKNNKESFENILKEANSLKKLEDKNKQKEFDLVLEDFKKILDENIEKIFNVQNPNDVNNINKGLIASSKLLKIMIKIHKNKIEDEQLDADNGSFE